jgi:hypothetical protein
VEPRGTLYDLVTGSVGQANVGHYQVGLASQHVARRLDVCGFERLQAPSTEASYEGAAEYRIVFDHERAIEH